MGLLKQTKWCQKPCAKHISPSPWWSSALAPSRHLYPLPRGYYMEAPSTAPHTDSWPSPRKNGVSFVFYRTCASKILAFVHFHQNANDSTTPSKVNPWMAHHPACTLTVISWAVWWSVARTIYTKCWHQRICMILRRPRLELYKKPWISFVCYRKMFWGSPRTRSRWLWNGCEMHCICSGFGLLYRKHSSYFERFSLTAFVNKTPCLLLLFKSASIVSITFCSLSSWMSCISACAVTLFSIASASQDMRWYYGPNSIPYSMWTLV